MQNWWISSRDFKQAVGCEGIASIELRTNPERFGSQISQITIFGSTVTACRSHAERLVHESDNDMRSFEFSSMRGFPSQFELSYLHLGSKTQQADSVRKEFFQNRVCPGPPLQRLLFLRRPIRLLIGVLGRDLSALPVVLRQVHGARMLLLVLTLREARSRLYDGHPQEGECMHVDRNPTRSGCWQISFRNPLLLLVKKKKQLLVRVVEAQMELHREKVRFAQRLHFFFCVRIRWKLVVYFTLRVVSRQAGQTFDSQRFLGRIHADCCWQRFESFDTSFFGMFARFIW